MDNQHLFELINAGPGLEGARLWAAVTLAQMLVYLIPAAFVAAWIRADRAGRLELLQMLFAMLAALAIDEVVVLAWPQPRPLALHLGNQYLNHANGPGLPSDHVTVFWTLALASLATRRYARWCFPMLALGLLVGWSRVYLGVHFPFDVLASFPVALAGALLALAVWHRAMRVFTRTLDSLDRLERTMRAGWGKSHKS